ncbi:MAG: hypothetical protein ACM3N6_06060, partial [Betaproteobacteria bacterium]
PAANAIGADTIGQRRPNACVKRLESVGIDASWPGGRAPLSASLERATGPDQGTALGRDGQFRAE